MFPAWLWQIATEYTCDPLANLIKTSEAMRARGHSNRQVESLKIERSEIMEAYLLGNYGEKPQLTVTNFSPKGDVRSSKSGEKWYLKLLTTFKCGEQYYRSQQEMGLWISDLMCQVLEHTVHIVDNDDNVVWSNAKPTITA